MGAGGLELHDRLIRSMSVEQKLLVSEQLRRTAWTLKAAFLRSRYPEEPEDAIQERVRQLFLSAGA